MPAADRFFQFPDPLLELGLLQRTINQRQDAIIVVPFGQVVESAVFNGLHPVGDVAVSGQQNNLELRITGFDIGHEGHPGSIGQFDVAQHHLKVAFFQQAQAFFGRASRGDLETFEREDAGEQAAQGSFVVDQKNAGGHKAGSSWAKGGEWTGETGTKNKMV